VRQDACLTRAGAGYDKERAPGVCDSRVLCRVEPLQKALCATSGSRRQCPIPMPCERWRDFPSVSKAGATMTSAFWNSFRLS
jgi:hypothetical protein